MAAIKPHLAEDGETTELEDRYWTCSQERDLGDVDPLCPSPQAVIDQSHAALLTVAMTRKVVVDQLQGRTVTPRMRGKEVALFIDTSVRGPAWNPMMPVEGTALLSWTTKMGAPSFSLPAGAVPMGGSCPGANAGQSVVPDEVRRKAARVLLPVLRDVQQVELAKAICEFCYAEGGQYGTGSVQYHQMIRYAWVRKALRVDDNGREVTHPKDSEFVRVMIEAIETADYKLKQEAPPWKGQRFFRLHDSGDFFSIPYLQAWKAITDHFHPDRHADPIAFWAPTRIWAMGPKVIEAVNTINGEPNSNLAIRPSAYHVNQHGPENLGPGWAASSVVFQSETKLEDGGQSFDWDCKAYAVEDGPSCRGAENPDGVVGCRVCWKRTNMRVNYTLH